MSCVFCQRLVSGDEESALGERCLVLAKAAKVNSLKFEEKQRRIIFCALCVGLFLRPQRDGIHSR